MKRMTMQDRRELAVRWEAGEGAVQIAVTMGYSPSAIYVELKRGATGRLNRLSRPEYDPERGQAVYQENLRKRGRRRKKEEEIYAEQQESGGRGQ